MPKGIYKRKEKGIDNMRKALIGRTFSKKHKINISKSKQGANHPNWKGGISPKNERIRASIEYKLWHDAVLARDGYIDQKTGIKESNLHTHHILNFSDYPELRFAIDNGVTLSKKSHKQFHKKYGFKNNTQEQLEEFLQANK